MQQRTSVTETTLKNILNTFKIGLKIILGK
jgi:hypothetical protein